MVSCVMLTRFSPEVFARPESVAELNRHVEDRIKQECCSVKWIAN